MPPPAEIAAYLGIGAAGGKFGAEDHSLPELLVSIIGVSPVTVMVSSRPPTRNTALRRSV